MAMCLVRLTLFLLLPLLGSGLQWKVDLSDFDYAFVPDPKHNISKHGYTWYEAGDMCRQDGGYLLYLESNEEKKILWDYRRDIRASSYYWIGLNDIDRDGNYTWSNGLAYTLADSIQNWDKNWDKLCYYASMYSFGPSNCGETRPGFICKRKKGDTVPKKRRAPVKVAGYCPDGWRDAGTNRCYRVFHNTGGNISWSAAVGLCDRLPLYKADIACANTKVEVDTLTKLASGCPKSAKFWFGLRNLYTKDVVWQDNTRVVVTNLHTYIRKYKDTGPGYLDNEAIPPGSWDFARDIRMPLYSFYICQIDKDPNRVITKKPSSPGGNEVCRPSAGGGSPVGTGPITILTAVMVLLVSFM